ncbi:MAG: hypothetical protein ACOC1X_00360 [Promethearchaeota archaeon]
MINKKEIKKLAAQFPKQVNLSKKGIKAWDDIIEVMKEKEGEIREIIESKENIDLDKCFHLLEKGNRKEEEEAYDTIRRALWRRYYNFEKDLSEYERAIKKIEEDKRIKQFFKDLLEHEGKSTMYFFEDLDHRDMFYFTKSFRPSDVRQEGEKKYHIIEIHKNEKNPEESTIHFANNETAKKVKRYIENLN